MKAQALQHKINADIIVEMKHNKTEIDWSEMIILFNSLIRNIEFLRDEIRKDVLDENDLYEVEEELNDYVVLLARLKQNYEDLDDKGELSVSLAKKLREIC